MVGAICSSFRETFATRLMTSFVGESCLDPRRMTESGFRQVLSSVSSCPIRVAGDVTCGMLLREF